LETSHFQYPFLFQLVMYNALILSVVFVGVIATFFCEWAVCAIVIFIIEFVEICVRWSKIYYNQTLMFFITRNFFFYYLDLV